MDIVELEIKSKLSSWFLGITHNKSLLSQCRSKMARIIQKIAITHTHTHILHDDFLEENQAQLAIYQNVSYLF